MVREAPKRAGTIPDFRMHPVARKRLLDTRASFYFAGISAAGIPAPSRRSPPIASARGQNDPRFRPPARHLLALTQLRARNVASLGQDLTIYFRARLCRLDFHPISWSSALPPRHLDALRPGSSMGRPRSTGLPSTRHTDPSQNQIHPGYPPNTIFVHRWILVCPQALWRMLVCQVCEVMLAVLRAQPSLPLPLCGHSPRQSTPAPSWFPPATE
jgi:hypothetical protein